MCYPYPTVATKQENVVLRIPVEGVAQATDFMANWRVAPPPQWTREWLGARDGHYQGPPPPPPSMTIPGRGLGDPDTPVVWLGAHQSKHSAQLLIARDRGSRSEDIVGAVHSL